MATKNLERDYNIPLRKSFRSTAKHKKTPRAVRTVKAFLVKHMKTEKVLLGMHLNDYLWKHGIKNPPHHVKVHVVKDGDVAKAELEGKTFKGAVKSEKKKEAATSMKDKLAEKLGATTKPEAKPEEKTEKPVEKEKPAQKPEEKTVDKPKTTQKIDSKK